MKKILLIVGLLLISLIAVACGPAKPASGVVASGDDGTVGDGTVGVEEQADDMVAEEETAVQPVKSDADSSNTAVATTGLYPVGTEGRRVSAIGDPNAPVIMVEYSDYQCPFCRRHFQEVMPQIKADFVDTGRVYYVFKDFPIASLHPLAYRLHEAALCAGDSGGVDVYWQIHDRYFANAEAFQQNSEENMDAIILAEFREMGLPMAEIEGCLEDGSYAIEVQSYIQEGQGLGVRGTPNFFINGTQLVGAQPYAVFKQAIEQAEGGQPAVAAQPAAQPAAPAAGPTPVSIPPREATAMGDPNAPVTIIEYSDYQCPFCRRHVVETMPQIKANFIDTGRVYYVFKDFPIASLHPLAYRQHEAALCVADAADADAYWQAHDLFFEKVETFQAGSVEAIDAIILTEFENAGLPDIATCLQSDTFADEVQELLAEGQAAGVTGTPAFFIDGYPVSGAQPYELFEYAVGLAEEGTLADAYQQNPNDGKAQATEAAQAQPGDIADVSAGDAPAKGSPDAPVTIIEYSDYQCPFCVRHFNDTMPQIQGYIDDGTVRYVFKDFPLHSIHPQAEKAHEAARCARELGGDDGYWAMHDLLFTTQDSWAKVSMSAHVEALKALASQAGLPQAEFDECLDSGRFYEEVNADVAEGISLGVNGTPAFFINGSFLSGAQPFAVFQQAIEQALATN